MNAQILPTKLHMPATDSVVSRPVLVDKLNEYSSNKLTVVAAPAGYGKTTLVCDWLNISHKDSVWFSIDENNDIPSSFWSYLCEGLSRFDAQIAQSSKMLIQQTPLTDYTEVVDLLIQDLLKFSRKWDRPNKLVLVLDDFHYISHVEIIKTVNRFLDYMPQWIHVVVTARKMPELSIPHRRSRLQVSVVSHKELAMDRSDIQRFLEQKLSLTLKDDEIDLLVRQTEGWVSAVLLAGLSLKSGGGISSSIFENNEFLSGFLLEEVFNYFDDDFRNALLALSTVPRFCVGLCDSLDIAPDSGVLITQLLESNLFVSPLDGEGCWFRLHPLLRGWLLSHQKETQKSAIRVFRQNAMNWFERNYFYDEAVEQAFLLEDWVSAYRIVCRISDNSFLDNQLDRFEILLNGFPSDLIQKLPRLAAIKATVHYNCVEYSKALSCLNAVYQLRGRFESGARYYDDSVHLGEIEERDIIVSTQLAQLIESHIMRFRGDVKKASELCRSVKENIPRLDSRLKCRVYFGLAMDCFINGQIEECIELSFKTISLAKEYKDGTCLIGIFNWVTEALKVNGRSKFALDLADENLSWIKAHSMDSLPNICLFYGAYLNLCIETNQLDRAWEMRRLIENSIHPNTDYRDIGWSRYFLHCDLLQICGRVDEAIGVLDSLELYLSSHFDHVNLTLFPKVSLVKALLQFQQGDRQPLLKWSEVMPDPDVNNCPIQYFFEQGAYALATMLKGEDASAILSDLREQCVAGGMVSTRIETYLIEAIGWLLAGQSERAMSAFSSALKLAAPYRFVNLFIGKGAVVEALLKIALPMGVEPEYCQFLLKEVKKKADFLAELSASSVDHTDEAEPLGQTPPLVEPLTPREKEVLEYIRQGYSNKKTADVLQLSPTTIRTHLQNIYGKLGVHTRTEAIALVNDMGLLA